MSKTELIIASSNLHKIREIREILSDLKGFDLVSLRKAPGYVPPEETGETFEANALLKAERAATALSSYVIAEDSGLVVPALDGRPGVLSARYAGDGASDADNRKKLLREMEGLEGLQRAAYFVCYAVLAGPHGVIASAKGLVEGMITEKERGGGGFGYDPLFLKLDYNKTLAELSESVKNRISHRYKALSQLRLHLERLQTRLVSS